MLSKTAKFLVVFCLLSVVCLSGAWADDNHMLPMLRMGVGARALAMGGAFVAEATDASAGYWNPAGLAYIERASLTTMYSHDMSFDRVHNFFAFGYTFNSITLGISWLNAGIEDIPGRDENDEDLGTFKDMNNIFLFSGAWKNADRTFAVGGNFKVVNTKMDLRDDYNKTGVGVDVGCRFAPSGAKYAGGLVVRDIGTKVDGETVPTHIQLGVVLYPHTGFSIPLDVSKTVDRSGVAYHMGGEYYHEFDPDYGVSVMAGINDGSLSMGAGAKIFNFRFDYSYVVEKEQFMNENHKISMSAEF
ncbi:MAG: PorV/PorQ family protein [candidate division Zixibacteria bacterium]|nr:PorV/PorQ family protein [candidate division Zixibacteria bacterium]